MFDPSSFVNPTPLAHVDPSRDVLPRGGTSQDYSSGHTKICKTSVFQGHKLVPYQIPIKQEGVDDHRIL
ncbi:hypothetical protein TNCV_2004981 [Trichonephila clavipes]|nr:hypothetical protein TNCV_2004981 [Trichonephila clavipes]